MANAVMIGLYGFMALSWFVCQKLLRVLFDICAYERVEPPVAFHQGVILVVEGILIHRLSYSAVFI